MGVLQHGLMPATCVRLMAEASRDPERLVRGSGLALRNVTERGGPVTLRQQLTCARNAIAMVARSDRAGAALEFAHAAAVAPSRHEKRFRREFGFARRERAAEPLADSRAKLGFVAAAPGCGDPANFSRACKPWHGATPRRARRP